MMAVSVSVTDDNSTKCLEVKTAIRSSNTGRNCESPSSPSEVTMRHPRKERRKTEMQIYRPGMGFNNKNARSDICINKPEEEALDQIRNAVSLSSSIDDFENINVKESRKRGMQIYRPGMGLQNKNAKSDDYTNKCDKQVLDSVRNNFADSSSNIDGFESLTVKESCTDEPKGRKAENFDCNKVSKNVRNRRPDIQVYTPKPKIVAQLGEKNVVSQKNGMFLSQSNKEREISSKTLAKKKSNQVENMKNYKYVNENDEDHSVGKESVSRSSSKHFSTKHSDSNSPQPTGSWADLVEDSDLSNSRSTPDDRLCNAHNDDSVDAHFSGTKTSNKKIERNCKSKQKHNRDEVSKKHRSRRSSHRTDSHATHDETNEPCKIDADTTHKSKSGTQEVFSNCEDKGKRNRNMLGSLHSDHTKGQNFDLHTSERGKDNTKRCSNGSVLAVKDNSYIVECNQIKPVAVESKTKSDKKKREKVEQSVPPRFQKNKAHSSDNQQNVSPEKCTDSGPNGGGGILKLPSEYEKTDIYAETFENSLYVPKFSEPQTFIHKQLFDPNNPSKPEIVNIPAPIPPTHMSYANMAPKYYTTESANYPSCVPATVQNLGYIPPPQPAAMSHQYHFLPSDLPANNVHSTFTSIRNGVQGPVHCPVPEPRLTAAFTRPPVCYNDLPHMGHEQLKKRLKPIVEKNLHDIVVLERELASLISKGICNTNVNALRQCRWKLQLRYENIILADPKYCAERNPEQSLWKTAFYQIIESLRKRLEEDADHEEETKENLLNIILEGTVFYENLLEKQQETYGFNLARLLEMECINSACIPEQIRVVLISTQKILIYLGDLARYKEQACQTSNFGKARSWYLKAQQIAPKNGRPYHQLALLAFNTRRKLDAVYYYMRSLAASNPFLSAKESLLSLFEEAKRKYEQYEKKRLQQNAANMEILDDDVDERCEVWIKPDGSSSQQPAEMDKNIDSSDVKNLSDVELNKRFVTSFLHVHGKLFTKVGMETFPEVLNNMLKEFYFLLQRTPLPLTSSRLLQLLAINIFSVANSSLKESGREFGGTSVLQEQALYTSMVMMSLLMERCHFLHIAHKSSPEYSSHIISDDLAQLLPSVKIWTDWMSCQKSLWPPPPAHILEVLNVGFNKNVWVCFAELLTVLREIDISSPEILNERTEDCEPIILEEESAFAGFVPLLEALRDPAYAVQPFDKNRAKHCLRISRIQFFGDYLCGISPPHMEFDIERKKFVSLVSHVYSEEHYERSVMWNSVDELHREDDLDDDLSGETFHGISESNELQMLWSRKEALSRAKMQQEKYRAQVQAVLQKHQNQRPIVLKIKPRYLIPDTNCFIDHLRLFRNILASTDFHLIIPLVVINELDGLARGTRVNEHTSPEHASRVTILSREAIHFLEEQFALRHPHLKAITSEGSVLHTISFRSEEMGKNKGTNDDLILTCCLYYCKDRAELFMPKNPGDPISLFREVVLLTDDRNLRVKALAHHVPVRDLLSFLQWANS